MKDEISKGKSELGQERTFLLAWSEKKKEYAGRE
jgi:hypothetical protein